MPMARSVESNSARRPNDRALAGGACARVEARERGKNADPSSLMVLFAVIFHREGKHGSMKLPFLASGRFRRMALMHHAHSIHIA